MVVCRPRLRKTRRTSAAISDPLSVEEVAGSRPGTTTTDAERLSELEREVSLVAVVFSRLQRLVRG
jgi:hypothetical protein